MAKSTARRPLPALVGLLALSILTALVWWRIVQRSDGASADSAKPSCTTSSSASVSVVPAPAAVTVTVLNSTDKNGLAGQVSGFLVTDGFKTGTPANDLTARAPVTGVAEIRFGPAGAAGAKLLSFYVPGATMVPDARTDTGIDLALGAKYTAVAATADVAKALSSAKLSQLPPPPSSAATTPAGSTGSSAPGSGAAGSSSASSSATSTAC